MKIRLNQIYHLLVLLMAFSAFVYSCQSKKDVSSGTATLYDPTINYEGTRIFYISEFEKEGRSDREAMQAMFDAVPEGAKTAVFDLQGRSLVLDGTVYYHKGLERRTKIIGNNARIQAKGDFDILVEDKGYNYKVSNGSSGEDISRWLDCLHIYDVDFVGGRNQLRIVGTLQSRVQNCRFWNGYRGIQMVFCLQAVVEQCRFQNHKLEGIVTRSGMSDQKLIQSLMGEDYVEYKEDGRYFSNATGSNCQSNRTMISNCRFYAGAGQKICARNQASDGVRVDNCIFEGAPCMYSVYHDSRGSTTVKSFEVIAAHIEHGHPSVTKALIYAHGGTIEIKGLFSQYGDVTQIDADGNKVLIETPRYMPLGKGTFKTGLCQKWKFIETDTDPNVLGNPDTWVGGVVPKEAIQISQRGIIGLNKYGMGFENIQTGARLSTSNSNPELPMFSLIADSGKNADLEHNIKRVMDFSTILNEQGKGMSLDGYEIAGTIPVYAYEADGDQRVVFWPLIGKKK